MPDEATLFNVGFNAADFLDGGHLESVSINGQTLQRFIAALYAVQLEANAMKGVGAISTTSLAVGTGSKTFTFTPTSQAWDVGQTVRAASLADPANYMVGDVTATDTGEITVNVTATGGTGTLADWFISTPAPGLNLPLAASQGGTGLTALAANVVAMLGAANYAAMRTLLGTIGLDLVATGTAATSSSIDLGDMDATSDTYMLFWTAIRPATDGDDLWLRLYDATLGSFQGDAGDYEYMGVYGGSDTDTISPLRSAADTKILLTVNVGNASSEVCSGFAILQNMYVDSSRNSVSAITRWATDATVVRGSLVMGVYKGTQNAVSKAQLLFSTGNIASGSAALFRVRKT